MHESYVVRIYRLEKGNPRMVVGTVEKVGEAGKSAFTNVDELWEIVAATAGGGVKNAAEGVDKGKEGGEKQSAY